MPFYTCFFCGNISFFFSNNIVYWRGDKLFSGSWKDTNVVLARNLYWDASGQPVLFGKMSLVEWRATGQDNNSLIADPLFVNPKQGDFRLRQGSPTTQIGFEPWDVSTIGPRPPSITPK